MKRLVLASVALLALVVAGAFGYFIAQRSTPAGTQSAVPQSTGRKILYWYDPMVPQQHFDRPGLSPMGMQMVPKYAGRGGAEEQNIVGVSPAEVQNLGMRTAEVTVGRLSDAVHVPGTVAWDQRLAVTVSARTDVTLEKLYVRAPFTPVKAGLPLAEILAPQWSAAAAEYFALGVAKSAEGRALRVAARARLHALGMDEATIRGLRASSGTITLRAPIDGVVSQLDVKEGQQVGQGMPIMTLNGLDKVWVDAAIPQAQSRGISAGTPITATISALPDETFRGEVEQLLPDVDPATRTQRARIVLDNPGRELAPGMFVDLSIQGAASAPHPLVPTGAIIADGIDTHVIEALGDGQFKPVLVKTGRSSGGMTAVLAGLQGGERIVTSGQFLIDSEASLSGALQRMGAGHAPSGKSEPPSGHADHYGTLGHGLQLSPEGEGKRPAMSGMKMPAASASNGHGDQP
ncbi:MAG: efflux RND transporter periplasmic adaptor subunit [Xanthomonadaceae bacterium]|nr:efflux RND transporter periplasmic adaptor subunit [Xanthomonadaceae bacterium]